MKKYSSYKDSGESWLGEIPSTWGLKKMKYLFTERSQKGFPFLPLLAATQNHGVIKKEDYENRTVVATKGLETLKLVKPNDFVISLRSFEGGIEISKERGIISPAYTVLIPKEINPKYFKYLGKSSSFINLLKSTVTGIREGQNIDYNKLKNYFLPIPSSEEQTRIANYLDNIIIQIDQAIALQQKMIDLLNERKQIIIQNAVTKGLDPNVEMKDSGMDWIEKIPSTWKRIPLRYICKFGKGLQITKADLVEEGLPVVSYGQVHAKYNTRTHLSQELIRFVPYSYAKDNENCLVHPREFIVADTSEDFNGCGNMVYNDSSKNIYAGYHTVILRDINFENPKYLAYLFASELWRYQVRKRVNGIKVYSITKGILSQVDVIKPSVEEQDNIVKYLDGQTYTIDKNIELIGKRISILQERKQIIINDVVTGKVKVC